jgi:hypothetical protein
MHDMCRARRTKNGEIDAADPIDGYWMSFHSIPNEDDMSKLREELGFFDKFGYGATVHDEGESRHVRFTAVERFVRPPFRPRLEVIPANKGATTQTNVLRLIANIGGRDVIILRVYVSAQASFWPPVDWVNIHALDAETGKKVVHQIYPQITP